MEVFADGPLTDDFLAHMTDMRQVVTPVVVYEVDRGLERRVGDEVALRAVAEMEETHLAPIDAPAAILAAGFSLEHVLPMADALIYAVAHLVRADLLTSDAHFRGLEGVAFIEG